MHKYIETRLLGEIDFPKTKQDKLIAPFVEKLTPVAQEKRVWHSLGFAGTLDALVKIDGKLTLIDWKTSTWRKTKSNCSRYIMQLAAYFNALKDMGEPVPDQALIVMVCDCPYTKEQAKKVESITDLVDPDLSSFEGQLVTFKFSIEDLHKPWCDFMDCLDKFISKKQQDDELEF